MDDQKDISRIANERFALKAQSSAFKLLRLTDALIEEVAKEMGELSPKDKVRALTQVTKSMRDLHIASTLSKKEVDQQDEMLDIAPFPALPPRQLELFNDANDHG